MSARMLEGDGVTSSRSHLPYVFSATPTMGCHTTLCIAYARVLVSASSPDQLVNPGKARTHRKVSPEEIDQIERELANLQGDVERIEETFAADHLNLVLATSYVRSLLRNTQITRYMETYHRNLLEEFGTICKATAPTAEAAE